MRAIIQRVSHASVNIDRQEKARIGNGLLILLGIEEADTNEDLEWLSGKISRLRIFRDRKGIMNLSLTEVEGETLVISQFTLHASTRKGNRPSYIRAARPETAIPLYGQFINQLSHDTGREVKSGEFGAYMQVEMLNDGPVTIVIDTKNRE
ncbi:MAG: D-tyrosyl-tRNA(Tyr) deacylase [Bacteroides sp. SM23_62]|nr:MAG: D-tyrosyl-tRNA(Tyr) deacylase [Bacteroides sp. SM23_62]